MGEFERKGFKIPYEICEEIIEVNAISLLNPLDTQFAVLVKFSFMRYLKFS